MLKANQSTDSPAATDVSTPDRPSTFNLQPSTPRRVSRWLLVTGFALAVFGAKLWFVDTAGSDLPVMDQWDGECEVVLRPWLEGWMGPKEIFHPHNEHRPVTSKLYILGLFVANGQWDASLENTANAAIHTACAVLLLLMGWRWLPRPWLGPFAALLGLLFTLPFSWENSLVGFQVGFYFLLLFSIGHIWLSLAEDRFSVRWALGQFSGLLAVLSLASGFFTGLAVLAALAHRLVRERRWSAQQVTTAALAVIFVALGWALKNDVPAHAALGAHTTAQFLGAFLRLLAWPVGSALSWSLLLFAPTLVFIVRRTWRRDTSSADAVLLGLVAWVLLQCAATAYARGGTEAVLSPRYLDLLAVNLAVGFLLLVRESSGRTRIFVASLWLGLVMAGLGVQSRQMWRQFIEPGIARGQRREAHVRDFLRTGDPAHLTNQPPGDIPYPVAAVLLNRLSYPSIQGILPPSVRRPVAVGTPAPIAVPSLLPEPPWPVTLSTWSPDAAHPALDWRSALQPASTLPVLRFRIAGDLGAPGRKLRLVVKSVAGEVAVIPDSAPGNRWKPVSVFRPAGEWWIEVHAAEVRDWFAFSGPVEVGRWSWVAGKLLKLHFILMGAGLAFLGAGGWLASRARAA